MARLKSPAAVLKTSNRVRVDTQLVEAETGATLWAGHFDRPLADVFAVQDDIVQKIVTTLNLQVGLSEQGVRTWQHTDNIEAYDDVLRGLSLRKVSKEGNEEARQLYEKAIVLDPGYSDAYYLVACTYYIDWVWQWNSDPHTLELAFANVRKAIALDDLAPYPHVLLGLLLAYQGHKDAGIAEAERGIALAPNVGFDYFWAAETMNVSGKYTKAFGLLEKAMRIDPRNADNYLMQVGNAYVGLHRCKEAVAALERFLVSQPRNVGGHFCQIVAYVECGMMEQARSEAAEVTKLSPEFSLEAGSFKGKSGRFIDDLRKAGLK
jgi:adenylate cyclase